MQPLNADDRTTMVSAAFTLGPFPINADGTYDLDWGTVTIPGETNPISASELTANVQTSGSLCGPLACGVANGLVTSPVMLPIDGSAWTMERMSLFVEPPKVNCAGDLADPL
jgi:hypothetical protein